MFKINLFIDNAWEFDKKVKLNPAFDTKTIVRSYDRNSYGNTTKQVYDLICFELENLLHKVNFNLENLGRVRVCVFDENEKTIESVTFRLAENGQIGLFANFGSLPNITTQMWGVWSKLNNLLLDRKVA